MVAAEDFNLHRQCLLIGARKLDHPLGVVSNRETQTSFPPCKMMMMSLLEMENLMREAVATREVKLSEQASVEVPLRIQSHLEDRWLIWLLVFLKAHQQHVDKPQTMTPEEVVVREGLRGGQVIQEVRALVAPSMSTSLTQKLFGIQERNFSQCAHLHIWETKGCLRV